MSASPSEVVLGRDREVRLEVPDVDRLSWAASEGELTAADAHHLVWRAPGPGTPRTAVLVIWDTAEAMPNPTVLRIPLVGRTELEVDTEPRASVTVELGGSSFGPRSANAAGKVKVPLEVPPGVQTATVYAEAEGSRTERHVPLSFPRDLHLVVAFSPHPMDAAAGGWLLVAAPRPIDAADVTVEVAHARLRLVRDDETLLYQIAPLPDANEVTATAEWKGQPATRTMTAAAVGLVAGPKAPSQLRFEVGGAVGGFFGRGAAKGFELALFGGVTPGWLGDRIALELELGWRHTGSTQNLANLGTLHSSINVLPILVKARYRAYESGPIRLGASAGLGIAPYDHGLSSDFQSSFREGGTTWELAFGADAAYSVGRWSPFVELGYAYSPRIQTPQVSAQLSGLRALLGVRSALP